MPFIPNSVSCTGFNKSDMSEEHDFLYDDGEAVKFIKNHLPKEVNDKFNEDDISYIIDLIYEFYESEGFMDGDDDAEVNINEDELIAFVVKNALADEIGKYEADDVSLIVQGELAYCDSIGMFE